MSDSSDMLTVPKSLRPSRRGFLGTATASAAGLALAAAIGRSKGAEAADATVTDADILNFALNLEYLEAEFYLRATTGQGLTPDQTSGTGTPGSVVSTPPTKQVTFIHPQVQQYAEEIAQDELAHVLFLRSALGSYAVAEPQINIGTAFDTLAQAAGIGASFDPFASETNFLLGAYIFEDVGVTAYNGAIYLLSSQANRLYAASIMATEAYHASEIRTLLAGMANQSPGGSIYRDADLISNLRDQLDGPGNDDQGILIKNVLNIVPTDSNSLCYARPTNKVLPIVYGNTAATPGLFYPVGMNGVIH